MAMTASSTVECAERGDTPSPFSGCCAAPDAMMLAMARAAVSLPFLRFMMYDTVDTSVMTAPTTCGTMPLISDTVSAEMPNTRASMPTKEVTAVTTPSVVTFISVS